MKTFHRLTTLIYGNWSLTPCNFLLTWLMLTAVTTHQVVSYACNWSRFLPGFQVVLKSSLVLLYCKGEKYVFDGRPLSFCALILHSSTFNPSFWKIGSWKWSQNMGNLIVTLRIWFWKQTWVQLPIFVICWIWNNPNYNQDPWNDVSSSVRNQDWW